MCEARRQARQEAKDQAIKYGLAYRRKHPGLNVKAAMCFLEADGETITLEAVELPQQQSSALDHMRLSTFSDDESHYQYPYGRYPPPEPPSPPQQQQQSERGGFWGMLALAGAAVAVGAGVYLSTRRPPPYDAEDDDDSVVGKNGAEQDGPH